ncbi:enoyl-CoA hydratase/isomerase family protein [Caballeronia sp. LZ034LL]|uniref:enoyl-CoA hydratase/isomerase family protein n=1 Tax=Caballeronia sp. LZ034LL TaxID=3038567 RepID=UPI002865ECF3|nr:enoyl-CoA hydratase/isomerase family protein [Caballeronia sp. LZ034LL]MDR5836066.1 enoyl-CoA hydratase/isomerase family protein [Caballeronia sp. LZ034LL]
MLKYTKTEDVARITFDSPATSNAITFQIMTDYIAALQAAQESRARFLLIDANGADFTVGRDQKERVPNLTREQSLTLILKANAALRAFDGVSIALINGRALGFGSGIALHSTISIGADDAVLGFDEIDHGLAPLVVAAYAPYYIAPRIAQELVITGRPVPAEEARSIGLLSRVVPRAELAKAGLEAIDRLSGHLPSALRLLRRYHERQARYPEDAVLADAVRQLATWIEQGKP